MSDEKPGANATETCQDLNQSKATQNSPSKYVECLRKELVSPTCIFSHFSRRMKTFNQKVFQAIKAYKITAR